MSITSTKKYLAPLALASLLVSLVPLDALQETTARADTRSFFVGTASCTAGDLLAGPLQNLISRVPGLGAIIGRLDVVPVNDKKALDFQTNKTAMGIVMRCGARALLNEMGLNIVNTARNNGRDGGASAVRNYRNFQTNAQYRGEAVFRSILANTQLCSYLQSSVRSAFRVSDRDKTSLSGQNIRINDLDPYTLRQKCTLPANFDLKKFQSDFTANGGWRTVNQLAMPENNFYDVLFNSFGELDTQRQLEQSNDLAEAQAGRGFLSIRGNSASDSCLIKGSNGRCIFYKDIKTPGSYLADALAANYQQELAWVANTSEMSGIIASLASVMLNRLVDLFNPAEGQGQIWSDPVVSMPCLRETPTPAPSGSPGASPRPSSSPTPTSVREQLARNKQSIQDLAKNKSEVPFGPDIPGCIPGKCYKDLIGKKLDEYDSKYLALLAATDPTDKVNLQNDIDKIQQYIIDHIKDEEKNHASQLLAARAQLLQQYAVLTGRINSGIDGESCPADPTPVPTPRPTTPGPNPSPSGSVPPNPGDCQTEIPAGQGGPFGADVKNAVEQLKGNPAIVNADGIIIDIDAYFDGLVSILSAQGYIVQRDGDQEINIYRSGATQSEQYAVRTSGGLTRSAWRATGCPLP